MATTTNFGWTKPDVGGSTGAWGGILNTLIDAVDSALAAVSTVASAALARAGGTMSGRLNTLSTTTAVIDKGSISGAQLFDLNTGQYFIFTVGGAMTPSFTGAPPAGQAIGVIFRITNGGAFAISWPAPIKWVSGVAPTLTAAGVDLIALILDDGSNYKGIVLGKDIR